jgi:hypothetical protein
MVYCAGPAFPAPGDFMYQAHKVRGESGESGESGETDERGETG